MNQESAPKSEIAFATPYFDDQIENLTTEDRRSDSLFWEPVATRRWGHYISEIELQAIQFALKHSESPSQALEIGAEGGRWSSILADAGWQMTCTEINAVALQVCQQRIPTARCVLVNKETTEFPVDNDSLGMLLAIEVHELVEQEWFIQEAARTLHKYGLFVGVFQNRSSWRAMLRNLKHGENENFKHYTASYAPWRARLKGSGFEMLRETGICWMPFGRMSDSPLIPKAVQIERLLGLRRLPRFSPWIVFVARKL